MNTGRLSIITSQHLEPGKLIQLVYTTCINLHTALEAETTAAAKPATTSRPLVATEQQVFEPDELSPIDAGGLDEQDATYNVDVDGESLSLSNCNVKMLTFV